MDYLLVISNLINTLLYCHICLAEKYGHIKNNAILMFDMWQKVYRADKCTFMSSTCLERKKIIIIIGTHDTVKTQLPINWEKKKLKKKIKASNRIVSPLQLMWIVRLPQIQAHWRIFDFVPNLLQLHRCFSKLRSASLSLSLSLSLSHCYMEYIVRLYEEPGDYKYQ